jgi:hypothetical protein
MRGVDSMPLNISKKLKELWNKQPDIIVFQPLKLNENPDPIPFEVLIQGKKTCGFILRQDEEARVLSQRGTSTGITVPSKWTGYVSQKLKPYLIQVQNKIGIVFMPENFQEEDLNE